MPRYKTDCAKAAVGNCKACSICPCDLYEHPHSASASIQLNPYQYVWGGQVRDKRSNSMAARPFFSR